MDDTRQQYETERMKKKKQKFLKNWNTQPTSMNFGLELCVRTPNQYHKLKNVLSLFFVFFFFRRFDRYAVFTQRFKRAYAHTHTHTASHG